MTDKKKLELIDEMIGNYYEFCAFDDEGMNSGALQMLIGCIEAVVFTENKQEEEESPRSSRLSSSFRTTMRTAAMIAAGGKQPAPAARKTTTA